jgi:pyruvate kinase
MRRHEGPHARQTRIVATLGLCPEPTWPAYLDKLCDAGADVFRLNLSHADKDYGKETQVLAWCNEATPNGEAPRVAVMADLQGPKARIGKVLGDGVELVVGRHVLLVTEGQEPARGEPIGTDSPVAIPVPEPLAGGMFAALCEFMARHPDMRPKVLFGDGDIALEVVQAQPHCARGLVVAGGVLGSRKGVTIREIDLDLDPFPAKDQRDLRFCLEHGIDFVAVSFVRTAADLERVRAFVRDNLSDGQKEPRLVAKIETLSAIEHMEEILEAAGGVMIARGDLGLQLGVEEVPLVQKRFVAAARAHGKPVIVATQMLESMIASPQPTRAEATDVFNAILDGGDAVMLSGETSVGIRPYLVVQTMDRIARKAESFLDRADHTRHGPPALDPDEPAHLERINGLFAATAVRFADQLGARAIVCFTRTGRTPERLSRHRPGVPILALCPEPSVARVLLLYYGVHPIVLSGFDADRQKLAVMVEAARSILHERYGMQRGDAIVVTAGINWPKGGTNALQVLIEDQAALMPR